MKIKVTLKYQIVCFGRIDKRFVDPDRFVCKKRNCISAGTSENRREGIVIAVIFLFQIFFSFNGVIYFIFFLFFYFCVFFIFLIPF